MKDGGTADLADIDCTLISWIRFKVAKGAGSAGVDDSFGNAFSVKVLELFD